MGDDAQNRTGTGQDPNTGKFLPGNRANPGGRPAGLRRMIDEESRDGDSRELVRFLFGLVRGDSDLAEVVASQSRKGEGAGAATHSVRKRNVPMAVRERAAEYLADQRWGRSKQTVTVSDGSAELEDLSDAEFKRAFAEQLAADPELLDLALAKRAQVGKPPESK